MRTLQRFSLMGLAALSLAVLGCTETAPSAPDPDPVEPPPAPAVPASIAALMGDGQTGEVGAVLAEPLVVKVRDASGFPLSGVGVTFAVKSGEGALMESSVRTDSLGRAQAALRMGYSLLPPSTTVTATVPGSGLAPAVFTATVVFTSGSVRVVSGDGQSGIIQTRLRQPPTVQVLSVGPDPRPVSGAEVHWQVTAGDGTISNTTSLTGPTGLASVQWTVGGTAGAGNQALTATVPSLSGPSAQFSANAIAAPAGIIKVSGDFQAATWGRPLPEPFVIRVLDTAGQPVQGIEAVWSDRQDWMGGSRLLTRTTTGASGETSATLSLGPDFWGPDDSVRVASVTVRVTEDYIAEATFYVTNR